MPPIHETPPMRALTMFQPWASLIVIGCKPFEFRKGPCPDWVVDKRIVIHASKRPIVRAEVQRLIMQVRQDRDDPRHGCGATTGIRNRDVALEYLENVLLAPSRAILAAGVGTAIIREPRRCLDLFGGAGAVVDSDRIEQHVWAWPLEEPEIFEPEIPARGFQGFWYWHQGVAAA